MLNDSIEFGRGVFEQAALNVDPNNNWGDGLLLRFVELIVR